MDIKKSLLGLCLGLLLCATQSCAGGYLINPYIGGCEEVLIQTISAPEYYESLSTDSVSDTSFIGKFTAAGNFKLTRVDVWMVGEGTTPSGTVVAQLFTDAQQSSGADPMATSTSIPSGGWSTTAMEYSFLFEEGNRPTILNGAVMYIGPNVPANGTAANHWRVGFNTLVSGSLTWTGEDTGQWTWTLFMNGGGISAKIYGCEL